MYDEEMEMGSTGMIALSDGTYLDKNTGNILHPDTGIVENKYGEVIFDPNEPSDDDYEPREY